MLIDEFKPDAISVEELFFNNNAKTAINVAQARGIILVVGCKNNIPTFEYTPLQVKQAVAGYGRADAGYHGHRAGAGHYHKGHRRSYVLYPYRWAEVYAEPYRHSGPC